MTRHCACTTIGELERAAGVPSDHASRFAFWKPFIHLKDGNAAISAAVAECERRIQAKLDGFVLPVKRTANRKGRAR